MSTGQNSATQQIEQVFPYLRVRGAAQAIEFYKQVFDAEEVMRLCEPGGRIGHAEIKIGPTIIMLSDEYPEFGICGPETIGGTGSSIHMHVSDVDALTQKAVDAGAELVRPPTDQFYGERSSTVKDPFGHEWYLGSHIEDVSPEVMQRRFNEMCGGASE